MDLMEIDFDFEDDPIKKFLLRKLDGIKQSKVDLEAELKAKNDLLALAESKIGELRGSLKLGRIWKRVVDSTCVFGIVLLEDSPKFLKVTLTWDSSAPLTYYTKLLSSNSNTNSDIILIVALQEPIVAKKLAYNLQGYISYRTSSGQYQTSLPSLQVAASDFTDPLYKIQRFELLKGADEDLLSFLGVTNEMEFVAELTKNQYAKRKVESIMEIDCLFHRVEMGTERKIFLVDGISPSIDWGLLELLDGDNEDDKFYFNVFTRSERQLKHLLHYLHKAVEGITILPRHWEEHLREEGSYQDFRRSLLQEITYVGDFLAEKNENWKCPGQDYLEFRNGLSDLEYQTDIARSKCDA